eukprot:m.4410 g.4410  ORF g.4410 m.4410 type:complete len:534 (+) comp3327_c0_seq2:119-1720(+)
MLDYGWPKNEGLSFFCSFVLVLQINVATSQAPRCGNTFDEVNNIVRVGLYFDNVKIKCTATQDYDCQVGSSITLNEALAVVTNPVWEGYAISMLLKLQDMAPKLNRNVTFTIVSLGNADGIADYTALLSAALAGNNDTLYSGTPCDIIGTGDTLLTLERNEYARFTTSIYSKQLRLITRNTTYTSSTTSDSVLFSLLFRPFSSEVWALFFGIMALFIICLAPIAEPEKDETRVKWGGFIMHTVQTFIGNGGGVVTEQPHARFVIFGWLFFCWILSTFYTANLTALLVEVQQAVPPHTFKQILDQKLPVCVLQGSAVRTVIETVLDPAQLVESPTVVDGMINAAHVANATCVAAIATHEEFQHFLLDPATDSCSVLESIALTRAHSGYMGLKNSSMAFCMEEMLLAFHVQPQGSEANFGCTSFWCVYNQYHSTAEPDCQNRIPSTSTTSLQLIDVVGPAIVSVASILFGVFWHFFWANCLKKHVKKRGDKMKDGCDTCCGGCFSANGLCVPRSGGRPNEDQVPDPQRMMHHTSI